MISNLFEDVSEPSSNLTSLEDLNSASSQNEPDPGGCGKHMQMQCSSPLVSALVTTFNHERFICDAIESLLDQTYPAVEIIVVDDGSHDRTFDLACQYRSRGVKVLRGPQSGPSCAMNMAMAHSAGEIFLLQSGDDMSARIRAEVQVRALADVDLHAGLPALIDGQGHPLLDTDFPVFFRSAPGDMKSFFKSLYEDGNFLCASAVALKRTVWEKIGDFHPGLLQLQDYDYWLRTLTGDFRVSVSEEKLAFYRIHERNLSASRHDVRMHREMGAIFRSLSASIPTTWIKAILYDTSFDGLPWHTMDREILIALLFLRHTIESVRQIGIEALMNVLADTHLAANLDREFGLSHRGAFDLFLTK